ncbi:uncharacterized protein PG986_014308 [Apiospora aurea]|uniref:Uncharacterized protein n=1 Tax=Apiospora aurea TaxID=335848 RepID=A0ABR1PSL8_9PEZI
MAHTKGQKDKNKIPDLGRYCNVFSLIAYWNPTHKRWNTAMHVPHGQRVPDLNRIPTASDDANAEYETDPEYIAAAPVGAAESLSVYDIIPDEDGGTVILHSPHSLSRQVGVRQLRSPQAAQGEHDFPYWLRDAKLAADARGCRPTAARQPTRTESSSTTNATPTAATNNGGNDVKLSQGGRPRGSVQNAARRVPDYYKDYRRKLQRATLAKKMVGMLEDLRTSLSGMQFG